MTETDAKRELIVRVAELLHQFGTPSHRWERVMRRIADNIGVSATFLYTPTALFIAFEEGVSNQTWIRRTTAIDFDLGKLIEFDETLDQLRDGELTITEARKRMEEIATKAPRYPAWVVALAGAVASLCAAVLFGGGVYEVIVAGFLGAMAFVIGWAVQRWLGDAASIYEPLTGFSVALLAILFSQFVIPIDHRLATLASLIVLIPGLSLTVAMLELANRHWSSGVARMAGTGATFFTLFIGVALAWRIGALLEVQDKTDIVRLPSWAVAVTLPFAPPAFSILFAARFREWPVIFAVAVGGFVAAKLGQTWLGVEFGPFFGAFTVGIASNLYARVMDRPAMVPFTPGSLILVPGSLGYLSLTSFIDQKAIEGVELAFGMLLVAVSLVGGFLAANAILPPRREL